MQIVGTCLKNVFNFGGHFALQRRLLWVWRTFHRSGDCDQPSIFTERHHINCQWVRSMSRRNLVIMSVFAVQTTMNELCMSVPQHGLHQSNFSW